MREVRTGGGRQFYEVMVWKGTPHPFEFLKWFPGKHWVNILSNTVNLFYNGS